MHSTLTPKRKSSYLSHLQNLNAFFWIIVIIVLLLSVGPFLSNSAYVGNKDLHATMEMVGALIGIIAGISLGVKFYALGNRFHLFIGLAFFVNGAEDLAHGLLSFDAFHLSSYIIVQEFSRFVPGTYVAGRLLMALLLVLAPFSRILFQQSKDSKHETKVVCTIAFFVTFFATYIASLVPLPEFIYPENLLSRPVDFFTAVIFTLAFVVFAQEYKKSNDRLIWWVALSIGINIAGQTLMGFSKALYDPFFDIAHFYKILGYCVPLIGFSFYHVIVIKQQKLAEQQIAKEHENFLTIFAASPVGLLLLDEDTMITNASKSVANMVLRDPAKIVGKRGGGVGCVHSFDDPRGCGFSNACQECPLRRVLESVLAEGHSIYDTEIEATLVIGGNPQKCWFNVNAEPVELNGHQHVIVALNDITQRKQAEAELKTLKGIIPICMHCKGIRDDDGCWNQLEKYISAHSEALFSHGICEKCLEKYYPDEDD